MSKRKSRRDFLFETGSALAAGAVGFRGIPSVGVLAKDGLPGIRNRPNILLIITDQQRYPQHWPSGWAEANLSSLKRLTDTGISFESAFCVSCMCSPSRASLFTGLYPAQHGVVDTLTTDHGEYEYLEEPLPQNLVNLATMLARAGYRVVYKGKWHLSKGQDGGDPTAEDVARYGFEGWDPPDAGQDTNPDNFGGGLGDRDNDGRFVDDAIEFIRTQTGQSTQDQPFALIVSLVNPHDVIAYPKDWEEDYGERYTAQGISLPPSLNEDLSTKPSAHRNLLPRLAAGLGPLNTPQERLMYVNFYAFLHKVVDGEINRLLDAVEAQEGLRDTTLIVRTSDHGEVGLSHGGMRQKMFNVYEETIRVPLIFSNPLLYPEGKTTASLASLVDLMPTLAHICDVPNRGSLKFRGQDLTPILLNPSDSVQDSVLFTFDDQRAGTSTLESMVPQPNHIQCIRESRWKYARYYDPSGEESDELEMYDLENDPQEVNNLAHPDNPDYNDPEIQAERSRLAQRLRELVAEKLAPLADLNGDGQVDGEDLMLFGEHWKRG